VSAVRAADLDATFVPRRVADAYTVEIDGDAIVLDEAQNRLHLLNASAALVWACYDGSATLAQIAHDLADATGVPFAGMVADVLAITRSLGVEGLVEDLVGDAAGSGVAVAEVEVSGPLA
jgi:hypothetical protein